VLAQDSLAVGFDFAEGDCGESGSLESKAKSPDSTEKIQNLHLGFAAFFRRAATIFA